MSTATWLGTDDDWTNTSNWSGGSGAGGVPADGDDVIFPSGVSQSVLSNVDRSAADLNLHSIFVAPGFEGDIGTSAAPLRCVVGSGTAPSIRHYGPKPFYFSSESDGAVDDTGVIIINSANRAGAMEIGGTEGVAAVMAGRGGYTIKSSMVGQLDEVIQSYTNNPATDVKGTIESGASDIQAITVHGGVLNDAAGAAGGVDTGIRVLGGLYIPTYSAGASYIYIGKGGTVDHRGGGTITACHLAGFLTFENSDLETTITDLYRIGGHIKYDEQLITITNNHALLGV